jgi:hypothetical protein
MWTVTADNGDDPPEGHQVSSWGDSTFHLDAMDDDMVSPAKFQQLLAWR